MKLKISNFLKCLVVITFVVILAIWFLCQGTTFVYAFDMFCVQLGLYLPNAPLALWLGLTMALVDGFLWVSLVTFKHFKGGPTMHMAAFVSNALAVLISVLPFFWEANLDSSLAMFALYKNVTAFYLYVGLMTFGMFIGLWYLLRPGVWYKHVVLIQACGLIVTDVGLFLATYWGLPVGLLTCVCVNICVAGIAIPLSRTYGLHVQRIAGMVAHGSNRNKDLYSALFRFLAVSRLISWSLASVYGPTNWCVGVNGHFAMAVMVILSLYWLYTSYVLLSAALDNADARPVIPVEPVLIYEKLVKPYVIVFVTYINLLRIRVYRGLFKRFRFLRSKNKMFKCYVIRPLANRLSIFVACMIMTVPTISCFHSAWLCKPDRKLALTALGQLAVSARAGNKAWQFVGGVTGVVTLAGIGIAGLDQVGVQSEAKTMHENATDYHQLRKNMDVSQMTEVDKGTLKNLDDAQSDSMKAAKIAQASTIRSTGQRGALELAKGDLAKAAYLAELSESKNPNIVAAVEQIKKNL